MIRSLLSLLLIVCLFFSCAQVKSLQQKSSPSAIPILHITGDTAGASLKISSLSIDIVTAANIATTRFDIVFRNSTNRILEGELEFPLADGQQIIQYALDVNGEMREGVVVEKVKARIAFENTVRKGIDPGLVEKTKGNNFRTRIYPIPANGTKHIIITIQQSLTLDNDAWLYQIPLYSSQPIDTFSLRATAVKSEGMPQLEESGLSNFRFVKWRNAYIAAHHETNFIADQTIAFTIPGSATGDVVLTEQNNDETYFYINSRIPQQYENRKMPASIGIVWDISASAGKRNIEMERALLEKYLSRFDRVAITLIPFNINTQGAEQFILPGGSAQLHQRLASFTYDGGTQLGAIDLSKYPVDEFLLFSDGLSTFGKKDVHFSSTPIVSINSTPSADYSYLKYLARETHGSFIDLTSRGIDAALEELAGRSLQVVNVRYNPEEITDIALPTRPIQQAGLSLAGKLKTAIANIEVELGFDGKAVMTRHYTIVKNDSSGFDNVKRCWASMKIDELDLQYEKNKDQITKLGKEFSIVTRNSSLIVLDQVEDYVENEIIPPASLQKEYFALLKQKQVHGKDEKLIAYEEAIEAMENLKNWWKKDPRENKKRGDGTVFNDVLRFTRPQVARDEEPETFSEAYKSDSVSYHMTTTGETDKAGVTLSDISMTGLLSGEQKEKGEADPASVILLNEWNPDEPYLAIMEGTPAVDRIEKYLSLKKQYSLQPSFFVDIAKFFFDKKEKQTALLVLSNIAEMKMEDATLLRILATQLLEAGEMELAIETFEDIQHIREEEPQSYRDLALAHADAGQYDKTLAYLYDLVLGSWNTRFGDVRSIALNEMNAIISAHPGVNTGKIDSKFIYAMPVDVRIVIGWNTDNSDIDLWVTDPRKEKCDYTHTTTVIGGKISSDVTQGYGPEEFCLKKAVNGIYSVDVNLFGDHRQTLGGPISITADLFTDFGKPQQKRKTINLRVTSDKEVINLGSLHFKS